MNSSSTAIHTEGISPSAFENVQRTSERVDFDSIAVLDQ